MNTSLLQKAHINAAALAVGIGLGCLALPATALAQGAYFGAGIGQSSVDIDCDLDITCTADEEDTGFKLFGGYNFTPNFGLEAFYVDLGEASITGTDSFLGAARATIEVSGFGLAAVGRLPVADRFEILGKAGLFIWDIDVGVQSGIGSGSLSDDGTDLMLGLGGGYKLTENLSLQAEWERFLDVGDDNTTGQSDVDLFSVCLVLRF